MVRLHPYQLVYFNSLVGGPSGAQNRFEMDYWGFSYKEAMQWLLSNNPGTIRVKACLGPGPDNAVLFADRARLRFVDTKEAEFMMCARWETLGPYVPGYPAVYRVTRDGAHLLYIRRIRHPDGSAVVPRR
jgi:hypothetical protein